MTNENQKWEQTAERGGGLFPLPRALSKPPTCPPGCLYLHSALPFPRLPLPTFVRHPPGCPRPPESLPSWCEIIGL